MNHPRDFPLCGSDSEPDSGLSWSSNGWISQLGDELGEGFFSWVAPQPVSEPHWVGRSTSLAAQLGLSAWLESETALAVLSGSATSARQDRKSTRLNSSHVSESRMPSSA